MSKGGKRKGTGRPPGSSAGEPKTRLIAFRCSASECARAIKLGNGNASKGIRRALAGARSDDPAWIAEMEGSGMQW